jgi:protein SCO1
MLSRRLPSLIGVSALFVSALAILFARPAAANGPDRSHFPNVELITEDGKTVHFYDDLIKGKIVVINLIYTTCHYSCPLETARLVQVQKKLGDRVGRDIFFYSISIDPEHDTPEVLKAYMEKFHVGPGWTFLTGKKADIIFLGRRLGIYTDASVNNDGHLPYLLLGNEVTGQWMRGSAMDNPDFQARMVGDFMDSVPHSHPAPQASASGSDGSAMANFDIGKYMFGRDCGACHTIGRGDSLGPDLLGVTHIRTQTWLLRMIQTPDELLDGNDPIATALLRKYNNLRMPNIKMGDKDADAILGYLEARDAEHGKQGVAGSGSEGKQTAGSGDSAKHPNR